LSDWLSEAPFGFLHGNQWNIAVFSCQRGNAAEARGRDYDRADVV
jgi:hypothetical protein